MNSTHVRYRVVALATGLGFITHLDRACLATLAPSLSHDLALTTVQMGYVFTIFQLAYAVFEIPTARWADRRGTRLVLTRIVAWWSCFTAATGAAFSYPVLLIVRFLFGVGEAGAWPCAARTFARWIPARERGTVQGVFSPARTWPAAWRPRWCSGSCTCCRGGRSSSASARSGSRG